MFTNTSRNNNNGNNSKSSNSSKQNIKSSLSYFSKFSKRSRRIDEPNEGGQFSKDISNDSNESNQLNTSSASSSGYMSGFKPIHSATNRPYTSQQHFYHFGGGSGANNCNDKTGATAQLTSDNSNGIDFDDTNESSRRLPNHHPHRQAKQFIGHQRQQQQQQTRYQLPQSNPGLLKGGHNEASAMRTPMMVPMMIEDNNIIDGSDEGNVARHESDNESGTIGAAVIGADGGELDVDGVDLIDDDIENLNGQLGDNNGNNYNGSTCYDASRLRSIYAARLNRSRDCALDTSMNVADQRNHHQYQERYFQSQPQQQQQQLQYYTPQTPNRSQHLPQKQYFNGQTNSFAPPLHNCSTSTYNKYHENENEDLDLSLQHTNTYHQPISAIYHQPNIPNYQLQQQYHSFSYLQPSQQYHQLQQQYPSSLIQRTLNASSSRLASSSVQLIPNTSSSHLESSSTGESSHSSSTGAPINSRVALQPTKSRKSSNKANSKMQNSRPQQHQHLTSDASQQQQQQQQHHHHHQRNLQTVGSRKKTHHNAINSNSTMADRKVGKLGLGCCAKMAKLLLFITNVTFWVSLNC